MEGGLRISALPLWVRGLVELGNSFDAEGGGVLNRGRLGLETRGCSARGHCGFVALEAGYQANEWRSSGEDTEHHRGPLVTGRGGLDLGGARWRFRLAIEISRYRHISDDPDSRARWIGGGGMALGVVHRL